MDTKREQIHEYHYDAFISYRHGGRDHVVAEQIQKDLERFHVPKAIQKATEKKHIGRIFRDQEELVLTNDITDEIRDALRSSRFLIIICSSRTSESKWVSREIDYFLMTHEVDHILTVVTEGEPSEVLPHFLLKKGAEPLCADYRLPKRKAKKQELPRIAAVLLGCGYDDLIQRAQQYRAQRFAAIAAAVAAISAMATVYLFWSRTQIVKGLEAARKNQAKYLSNEVENLLENDLDVTAAELALYTVPENRKQTTPQSRKALYDAAGAYVPQETTDTNDNIRVVGELHSSDPIYCIRENHDKNKICTLDITGHIHAWDAETHKDILSFQETGGVVDLILADDVLVVGTDNQIAGYGLKSGKKIWTLDRGVINCGDLANKHSMETNREDTQLIVLNYDADEEKEYLSFLNPADGTILNETDLTRQDANLPFSSQLQTIDGNLVISDDGTFVAFTSCETEEYLENNVWIYNITTGQLIQADISLYSVYSMIFLENGTLIVSGASDEETYTANINIESGSDSNTISEIMADVYCISPKSGKKKWKSDLQYSQSRSLPVCSASFAYEEKGGNLKNGIYVSMGNVLQTYDPDTGNKINRYELPSSIALVAKIQDNPSDPISGFIAICCDGTLGNIYLGESEITFDTFFQKTYKSVLPFTSGNESGYFVLAENDSTVLQYILNYSDSGFQKIDDSGQNGAPVFSAVTDSVYAVIRDSVTWGEGSPVLEIYDRKTKRYTKSFQIQNGSVYENDYLGVTDSGKIVYVNSDPDYGNDIYTISMKNGKIQDLPINYETGDVVWLKGNNVYYIDKQGLFCQYNVDTGEKESFKCLTDKTTDHELDSSVIALSVAPKNDFAFIGLEDGTARLLDIKEQIILADYQTGDALYQEDGFTNGCIAWDEDADYLAVAGYKALFLFDLKKAEFEQIPHSGSSVTGLYFYNDMLLTAFSNGNLNRYSISDKKLLGTTQCSVLPDMAGYDRSRWELREDGTILLYYPESANIIDITEWIELYHVPNCLAFDSESDIFLTYDIQDSDQYILGYFPDYTLDDLLKKCKEAGNDQNLDDETRYKYGIEDLRE